jgi:hypothetical protein
MYPYLHFRLFLVHDLTSKNEETWRYLVIAPKYLFFFSYFELTTI